MANFVSVVRTNYFHVSDPDRLAELAGQVYTDNGMGVKVFESEGKYAFGEYDGILGIQEPDGEEGNISFFAFCEALQNILVDGDAIIITEIGYEKLRYLQGMVTVITKDKIDADDLSEVGVELARKLLGNPEWNTRSEH